jgi:ring-1,2-phenylacetyl-CoA epoxidase subunit PaaE
MSRFHKLNVLEVVRETPDAVSVTFQIPPALKEEYVYKQGQYVTLKLNINNEEIRRSYSICSNPFIDTNIRVAVKQVKGGRGSTLINEKLKAGDSLEVMTPMGTFYTELNPVNEKHYILFAGGSGITPMMSIIKAVLTKEPKGRLTLFYANWNETSIIFKKELGELVSGNSPRLSVYHILNERNDSADEIFKGILSPEKTKALVERFVKPGAGDEYFVCGPGPMMDSVKSALENLKIEKSKIHIEYFTIPAEPAESKKDEVKGMECDAMITIDGDEYPVHIKAGTTVLQAALDAGLDAPYSCRGGNCCTCRAKLLEGKAHMIMNYALLDSETAQGYILTCQSVPLTHHIVVDYDEGR